MKREIVNVDKKKQLKVHKYQVSKILLRFEVYWL